MHITEDYIRSISYPEFYDRGLEYFRKKKIIRLVETTEEFRAEVKGSEVYHISIGKNDLIIECECPAHTRHSACKHIVAVMIAISQGITSINHTPVEAITPAGKRKIRPVLKRSSASSTSNPFTDLKKLIRSQQRQFGRWSRYFHTQDYIYEEGLTIVESFPPVLNSVKQCLEFAVWYDTFFEEVDDSNGTNQDLQNEILVKAVKIALQQSDQNKIWKIFKPYLFKEGSFGVGHTIAASILSFPNWLAEKMGEEIITLPKGPANMFQLLWIHYLYINKDERFETKALSIVAVEKDISILELLIKYYADNNQYDQVIKYGWSYRDNYEVYRILHVALKKSDNTNKLLIFLKERLSKHFDRHLMQELKQLCESSTSLQDWGEASAKILTKYSGREKIESNMFLGRYAQVAEDLTSGKHEDYPPINIQDYAFRLTCLDKQAAKIVFWYLVHKEVQKFKSSNYYPTFFVFIDELRKLENENIIFEYLSGLMNQFPTKKKLLLGIQQVLHKQ